MTDAPIVSTIPASGSNRTAIVAMSLIFAVALIGAITALAILR